MASIFFRWLDLSKDFFGGGSGSGYSIRGTEVPVRLCGSFAKKVMFGPGIFRGFVGSPRYFSRFWFLPPFDHRCDLNPEYPPLFSFSFRKSTSMLDDL